MPTRRPRVLLFVAPVLLFLATVLLLGSCGGDSGSEPETPSNPPLATGTIGADGGSIEAVGLRIDVPAGAFTGDETLSVYADADNPYAAGAVSSTYELRGLPADHAAAIPLRLTYTGELEGESYILAGVRKDLEGFDQPITDYVWLAAADSTGVLYAELPVGAFTDAAKDDAGDLILYLIGITDMVTISVPPNDLFLYRLRYPSYLEALIPAVKGYIFDSLLKYEQQGMMLTFATQPSRMISHMLVTIGPLESWFDDVVAYAFLHGDPLQDDPLTQPMRLQINEDLVTQAGLPALRMAIGKELFDHVHYAQMRTPTSAYWWLREGAKTYLEEHFTDTPDHVPAAFVGRETAVLRGVASASDPDRKQDYAYAFGSVIKYANADRDTALGLMYRPVRLYSMAPEQCVGALFDYPVWNWFPGYIRALVTEQIYALDQGVFLRDYAATHTIAAAADTLWSVRRTMGPISADAVRVNLDWADINAADTLHVTASDPAGQSYLQSVVVFADHGGTLTWFGSGEHVVVDDVGQLRTEGADLLIYLVDATSAAPYDATRDVDLQVYLRHHAPPGDHPVFNRGSVDLFVQPAIATWDQRGLDCVGDPPAASYQSFRSEAREGAWDGLTFRASWYDTSTAAATIPNANEGSLEITLAADGLHVLSFTYEKETRLHYSTFVLYGTESLSYAGESIPETTGDYLPACCYYMISGPVLNTTLAVFRERWSTAEDCVEFITDMTYEEGDEIQIEFSY